MTLSWHDARQACASFAGNYELAIVETEELFEFLKKHDSHWIGLYSRKGNEETDGLTEQHLSLNWREKHGLTTNQT